MVILQDETKIEGSKTGEAESNKMDATFEAELTPVQRYFLSTILFTYISYALKFLETVNPQVVGEPIVDKELQFDDKAWELEMLQKIKEEEDQRMDEDDEVLFYEVVV